MIDIIHNPAPVEAGLPRLFIPRRRKSKVVVLVPHALMALHGRVVPVLMTKEGVTRTNNKFIYGP
jgi:hypothetical protein